MNLEELKIGQRVQVRDWDEMVEEFGYSGGDSIHGTCFIRGMDTYCGQFATIKGITTSGNYYLDICNYIFDRQTLRTIEECDEGEGENEGVPICPMMTFDEAVAFNT